MQIEKLCKDCNIVKPAHEFSVVNKTYLNTRCKACVRVYFKARYVPSIKKPIGMCTKCKLILPPDAFAVDSRARSGLSSACKSCIKIQHTAYRKTNGYVSAARKRKGRAIVKEWAHTEKPISWNVLRGDRSFDTYKVYPSCTGCFRKYLPQLGCIWCTKIYGYSKTERIS